MWNFVERYFLIETHRAIEKTSSVQSELPNTEGVEERLKEDTINFQIEMDKVLTKLETDLERLRYGQESEIQENQEQHENVSLLERQRCLKRLKLCNMRKMLDSYFSLSERLSSSRLQIVSFGSFQDVVLKIDGLIILFDPFDTKLTEDEYFRELNWSIIDNIHNFEVDVVVLSACVYSFSDSTVRKIVQQNQNVKWIVPPERKDWLIRQEVDGTSITVFEFWDEKTLNIGHQDISVVCTPTHRNSVSSGSKMCNTCGWIVKGSTRTFYSTGFTNYDETTFLSVKEQHGPIHLALLPISSSSENLSCSPEFSVEIDEILEMHKQLQPCTSLGIDTRVYGYNRSENKKQIFEERMKTLDLDCQRFHFLEPDDIYMCN